MKWKREHYVMCFMSSPVDTENFLLSEFFTLRRYTCGTLKLLYVCYCLPGSINPTFACFQQNFSALKT